MNRHSSHPLRAPFATASAGEGAFRRRSVIRIARSVLLVVAALAHDPWVPIVALAGDPRVAGPRASSELEVASAPTNRDSASSAPVQSAPGPQVPPSVLEGAAVDERFKPEHLLAHARLAPTSTAPRPPSNEENASPPGDWTLDQLTRLALENNPVLRRARARIESARGTAWQAGIWTNPRWDTNNPYVIASPGQAENAGFQQNIPTKGKKRLDRAAALQQVREATFAAWSDRYDLLQSVRAQFYALRVQQERAQVLADVLRIATRARDAAQRLFDNGQVAETDVLEFTLDMQEAESALQQARTLLVSRRRQLAVAVGLPDLPIGEVKGDLTQPLPPFDDLFVRQYVANENVDVQSARAELNRANLLLNRAEVQPYPNLYTGPAVQWGPFSADQFWWNIQFSIPAWDLNQGGIAAARWKVRGASADLRVIQNQLLNQAASALGRHRAAVRRAEKIRREVLPIARKNFELTRRGYPAIIPVFQLLQAQRAYFDASLGYLDALEEVWISAAELSNLLQLDQFP